MKVPSGGFVPVPPGEYDLFQLRSRRLSAEWATDGALYIVEVYLERGAADETVAGCVYRRHRIQADGGQHPEDARAQMESLAIGCEGRRPAPHPDYPNLIEAATEFRRRRLARECSWQPTPQDERGLGDAIEARLASERNPAPQSAAAMSANTVLLVEDDLDLADTLIDLLLADGYRVVHAKTGLQALRILGGVVPDLMVLDLNLPDVSGWTVMQMMRDESRLAEVPVIVTTASLAQAPAGARTCLCKPVRLETFLTAVHSHCR